MGLRRLTRKLLKLEPKPEPFQNLSFSQEGEDLVLGRIFEYQPGGFFVDVGAHHPQRFSNTYKFYKLGWRGINIDATPGSMDVFQQVRPEDINLEIPVSDKPETLDYYVFNEGALNTFSKSMAEERSKVPNYHIEQVVKIQAQTLETILDQHMPKSVVIDFMSVDVEGWDFNVLRSNNWKKYRPKLVLLESDVPLKEMMGSELDLFMEEQGYALFAKTVLTYFYKRKDI